MKKRVLGILVVLAMVMCLAPATGFAVDLYCAYCDDEPRNTYYKGLGTTHSIYCSDHNTLAGSEYHYGGTATCASQAVCDGCRTPYGNKLSHSWEDGKCSVCQTPCTHSDANNDSICDICNKQLCEHKWVDGKCSVCKTACTHTWEDGKCSVCGVECTHGKDENHDHMCDICGKQISKHTWEDGKCSVCDIECLHTWEDGKCSVCEYACPHGSDENHDHMCDICGKQISKHSWVNSVCIECFVACTHTWTDGKCGECGYACPHGSDENHDHMCDTCGKQISEHKWTDGKCTECGYTCTHSGGKVTCTEKAVCKICGEKYGEIIGHWYGEWTVSGNGTQTAVCQRAGCEHTETTDCRKFDFAVANANLVFCPVCGWVENGEHLELIEEAQAQAVTKKLPNGELVARMNDEYLSIAFEHSGKLTRPEGQVKITLPAELIEGKTLTLIAADGTETDLAVEIDSEGEYASFTLDFTDAELPAMLIRLDAEA